LKLGAQTITDIDIRIPRYGLAKAMVTTDADTLLEGAQTLAMGDLSLVGTIERGGLVDGRAVYDWTAGAGGWGSRVTNARVYESAIGVSRFLVCQELAADVGETAVLQGADTRLPGTKYLRPYTTERMAVIAHALLLSLGVPWHVAPNGSTIFGERIGAEVPSNSEAVLVEWAADASFFVIDPITEALAAWLPGNTYRGQVINELTISVHEARPRLTIYTVNAGEALDLGRSMRRMITGAVASMTAHHQTVEYKYRSSDGATSELEPTDARNGFGPIHRALQYTAPGMHATPKPGTKVLVNFRGGDPLITGFQALDETNGVPIKTRIYSDRLELGDADDLQLVARKDDLVNLGSISWTFTPAAPPLVPTGNWVWTFTDAAGATVTWTLAGILPGFTLAPLVQPPTPLQGKISTPSQGKVFA
jgi:hypothetical protein